MAAVLCSLSGEHPVAQPQLSAQRAGYPRAPQFREEPSNAQMRSTNAPQSREGPWKATNAFNICALVPPRSTNAPRFREGPSNVQGGVGRTLSGQDRAGQLTVVPQPFAVSSPERQRPAQLERFRRPVAKPQRSAQVLGAVSAVSTVRTSAFRGES